MQDIDGNDEQEMLELEAAEADAAAEEEMGQDNDSPDDLGASEMDLSTVDELNPENPPEAASEDTVFVDSFQLLSVIESLLFASDRPLSLGALKQVFANTNVDTRMIKRAMDEMSRIYADPTRGVSLEEVTGGWQLRTKLDNMDFLKKISKARPFRLSGPALEVLSIIAYKQPIVKNEVDQIRGVESGHLVRALMEKGLVHFGEKTDLPGKPMSYATTKKFLEIFGLRNLNELPTLSEIDQLIPEGIGDDADKETLSDVTEMLSKDFVGSYSEGEDELLNITEKIQSIDTSSEFFEQEKVRQKQKKERERAEDIREALAMGETVENKDIRWLERYELQLAEGKAADEVALQAQIAAVQNAEALEDQLAPEPEAQAAGDQETEAHIEGSIVENDAEEIDGDIEGEVVNENSEMYFEASIKEDFVEELDEALAKDEDSKGEAEV